VSVAGTAGRLAAATAVVMLAGPVPPAAAGPNEIVPPAAGPTVVTVEVPVRDWVSDVARMGASATLGAALAAQVTATRIRRRRTPPPPAALIDITDTVQLR
jgi:hypothetical protein